MWYEIAGILWKTMAAGSHIAKMPVLLSSERRMWNKGEERRVTVNSESPISLTKPTIEAAVVITRITRRVSLHSRDALPVMKI